MKASYDLFLARQDYANAAWSAINLGDIQRFLNQWQQGVPIYQQAIQLARQAKRADYETKALARLAYSELRIGQTDAAADHAQAAVRVGAGCGNQDFYFDALDTAADVEVKRGNLTAAGDYLDRALAMSGQIDKQQLYVGYADRGDVYYQKSLSYDCQRLYDVCYQALEKAKSDFRTAQGITQELGYTFLVNSFAQLIHGADVERDLLKKQQGEDASAEDPMFAPKEAKDVLVTENFASGGMDAANLAVVEQYTQQFQEWQARMQKQGLTVQDLNPDDFYIRGSLAEMKGDLGAALAQYMQAVHLLEQDRRKLQDEQARSTFMEDKASVYYRPALILLGQKNYSEAFSLFEQSRSRTMADELFSRPVTLGSAHERDLFSQLQAQRALIASKEQDLFGLTSSSSREQNGKKIVDLEREITRLQQQYQELETRVGKEAPRLKELTSSDTATLESVKRDAGKGGFDLLYYVVSDPNIYVWDVNSSEVHVKKVFLPRTQLMTKTAALRTSLETGPDTPFDEEHSRQLFLFLVQPVLPFVRSNHIIVVPHEELNSIPFQALQDPKTEKYLGESYAISYAPSATVLESLSPTDALKNGKLLAVADSGLAEAIEEVTAIGKLYPGRGKVAQSASKAELKSWVGDYNVVHLSMHGEFKERDPFFSYLQLKQTAVDDGKLTAAEMFGLPLEKNSVVVLSACETGRVKAGHANEVEGMVRALLYAGAGTLVLSSWKVNAAATTTWMESFYGAGKTAEPAAAARQALIAVKSRPNYSHPYFWAPFSVTGK